MQDSKIEWTDHTFNPWIGCQKISAGCDHCYAEALSSRYRWVTWGKERRRTSAANWRKPLGWQRQAEKAGERQRVFCASLADVFDNRAPVGARDDLWHLMQDTPALDWQILTKRPQNIARFLPRDWNNGWQNVWLGITAEDQRAYDVRWPILAGIPAAVRYVSYEPAIGPLVLGLRSGPRLGPELGFPDWLIWGGESGPGARVMETDWARAITRECLDRGVAVFGKQWGTWKSNPMVADGLHPSQAAKLDPHGKGGALLDGRLWRQFPKDRGAVEDAPAYRARKPRQLSLVASA